MKEFPQPAQLRAMHETDVLKMLRGVLPDVCAMILVAHLRGETSVRVPQDMMGDFDMIRLVKVGYAIVGLWYVAYIPGYVITWK